MVNILDKNEIITRYRNGQSIKAIARETGLSRNTVRSYVRQYDVLNVALQTETDSDKIAAVQNIICSAPVSKPHNIGRKKFTPEVEQRFHELIDISERRDSILGNNKQRLTRTHLWRVLQSEGYDIGVTTIKQEYRKYLNKNKECFIRQNYPYGLRAEFDFHQVKLKVGGQVYTYHQTTISCPASNHIFGLLYRNETQKTVIDSIVRFINHCGGVFEEMVFDNMSSVVKRFISRGEKQYTEEILKLSSYYGFRIVTCNPRKGNEKGHVENSGKFTRAELFSLKYEFDTEEALFDYYYSEIEKLNVDNYEKWTEEKNALGQKPLHDYLIFDITDCKVDSYALVSIEGNKYSVPDTYVGKVLTAHIFTDRIVIYDNTIKICSHKKIKGSQEYSIDITHYINTFLKKPGALRNSVALQQSPELKRIFDKKYSTEPKKFIEEILIQKDNKENQSIELISSNQLKAISKAFNQEVIYESDRTVCY